MKTELAKIRYGQKFLFEDRLYRVNKRRGHYTFADRLIENSESPYEAVFISELSVEPVN